MEDNMKSWKKIIAIGLTSILALAACGCGSNAPASTDGSSSAASTASSSSASSEGPRKITIGVWWDIYYDSTHNALEDNPAYAGIETDQMLFDTVKRVEDKYNVEKIGRAHV